MDNTIWLDSQSIELNENNGPGCWVEQSIVDNSSRKSISQLPSGTKLKKDKRTAFNKKATAPKFILPPSGSTFKRSFRLWLDWFRIFNAGASFGHFFAHQVNRNQIFIEWLVDFLPVISFILLRYKNHQFWYNSAFVFLNDIRYD